MKKWLRRVLYFCGFLFILLNVVAAFHAYKFTHFYDNNRSYTKKPEEMSGLEKAKVILFGVNYVKRPLNSAPDVPYENVAIETDDELQLKGWYVPVTNPVGTIIMFHGHGGTRSGVLTELKAFHQLGYNVFAIDFRAHGESAGNVCTIGFKETADVKAAYRFIRNKGENNLVLWGASMGAATIMHTLAETNELSPAKVILEMPFGSLTKAVEARLRMMNLPPRPLSTLLTFWGGTENGFWAFSHRPTEYAKEIKAPVLLQWGRNDSRVSENETTSIFENLSSSDKRLVVYENSGHESLAKKEPAKWITNVAAFLAP